MSVSAVDAGDSRRPGRVLSTRLARAIWLEHRGGLLGILAIALGFALAILIGESSITGVYHSYVDDGCVANALVAPCGSVANTLAADENFFSAVVIALFGFPVIVGLFLGAPMLSRELESGSFRFTWTQAVGRRRHLLVTVVALGATVAALAAGVGALLGWFAHPFEVAGLESPWHSGIFNVTTAMLPAWSLFALGLGVLVGALVGRVVAAMALTATLVLGLLVGAFVAATRAFESLGSLTTSRLSPDGLGVGTLNVILNLTNRLGGTPGSGWLIRSWIVAPNGERLSTGAANALLERANTAPIAPKVPGLDPVSAWLHAHAYTYLVSYQPTDRLWLFQAGATLLLAVVALLLSAGTLRAIRARRGVARRSTRRLAGGALAALACVVAVVVIGKLVVAPAPTHSFGPTTARVQVVKAAGGTVVPNVIGLPESQALATVHEAGLRVELRPTTVSPQHPVATIASESPAPGATVAVQSWVTLGLAIRPGNRS